MSSLESLLSSPSLWRPINGPVETFPLAVCDGRTVSPSAILETDRVRRTYTGGTTFVLQEPGRKWYYLNRQTDDEVTLFKNFDSDTSTTPCRTVLFRDERPGQLTWSIRRTTYRFSTFKSSFERSIAPEHRSTSNDLHVFDRRLKRPGVLRTSRVKNWGPQIDKD